MAPPVDTCPICQEEMWWYERKTAIDCSHTYHTSCISAWAMRENTCPVCRKRISKTFDPGTRFLQYLRSIGPRQDIMERIVRRGETGKYFFTMVRLFYEPVLVRHLVEASVRWAAARVSSYEEAGGGEMPWLMFVATDIFPVGLYAIYLSCRLVDIEKLM